MFQNGGSRFTGNRVNVNTRCETFWSDAARLEVGLWNNFLSIKLSPAVETDARGLRQYETDPNRILNLSLRLENVEVLLKGIEDEVIPAATDGKAKEVSFLPPVGREGNTRKLPRVGYDPELGTFYLAVTADINQEGKGTDDNTVKFNFEKKPYIVDYDLATGGGENVETTADFTRFKKILEGYTRVIPMEHHGVQYNAAFQRPQQNGGGFYNQQGGGFNGGYQQQGFPQAPQQAGPQYSAPVTSFDGGLDGLDLPF